MKKLILLILSFNKARKVTVGRNGENNLWSVFSQEKFEN